MQTCFNNKFLPIGKLAMLLFFNLPNTQLTNMAEKPGKRHLDFYTYKPAIKLANK
jgi:hypothetical protein